MAFPAFSCGIYGYPLPEAAHIAVQATPRGLEDAPAIFAWFGQDVLAASQAGWLASFAPRPRIG